MHLDVPVNDYRWFRGFNDYDNWQASGVSGQGARSFYYPAKPQKCADCHMPLVPSRDPAAKDGKVKSHRFAAANTALPFVNKDPEQLKAVQDFLRDGQISVDVFGIVRADEPRPAPAAERGGGGAEDREHLRGRRGVGELRRRAELHHRARRGDRAARQGQRRPDAVRRGESVRVEVVVRTRKVGHFFPGGTVDAFDVWVELEATDDKGRTMLAQRMRSRTAAKGPVEPGAHFYRSLLLDEHGNPINKRNAWAARSVAYVRLIPPGAADTIHYRLQIPPDAGDRISPQGESELPQVRLVEHAVGVCRRCGIPSTRISRWPRPRRRAVAVHGEHGQGLGSDQGDSGHSDDRDGGEPGDAAGVACRSALPAEKAVMNPPVRERWNDYGIGLLLQGDIRGAEAAFLNVTRWTRLRGRLGQRRARADPGRQHGGGRRDAAQGARASIRSSPRRISSWAPRSRASAATTKR